MLFRSNDAADRLILKPAATVYAKATPELFQFLVGNFFTNLGEISNTVNNLLQGKPKAALLDATRFTVNMTIGFLGLGDPATELGIERSNEDLGQTLGKWGLPTGPYLIIPFLGSSSARDFSATFIELPLNPVNRFKPTKNAVIARGIQLIDTRAGFLRATELIDGAALDSYTFVRNGYFQRRLSLVYDGDPPLPDMKEDAAADEKAAPKPDTQPATK